MSLDGVIYIVRLFELQVDDITIDESRRVVWPKLVDIPKQPSLDGVLILYDVTDEESVNEIPDILCKSAFDHPAAAILRAAYTFCRLPCSSLIRSSQMHWVNPRFLVW